MWGASSSYRPVRVMAVSNVQNYSSLFVHFVGVRFMCGGGDSSIISVGSSRQRRGTHVLFRRAGSSGISWRIPPLAKKTLSRHRADLESQRALSFRKCVKAPNTWRSRPSSNDDPSLVYIPLHCFWCWRAPLAAINTFAKSLHYADHHPARIWDERERLVTARPVITKS